MKSTRRDFLSLPPEIRCLIYTHLLIAPEPLPTITPPVLGVNILRTCRQVYSEAVSVLYGSNQWTIQFQSKSQRYYEYFLSCLSIPNAERIRNLEIILWGDFFDDIPMHRERRGKTYFIRAAGIDMGNLTYAKNLVVCLDLYQDPSKAVESDVVQWFQALMKLSFKDQDFEKHLVFDPFVSSGKKALDALYGSDGYKTYKNTKWFQERRAKLLTEPEPDLQCT